MDLPRSGLLPAPVLLVRPTGGGKSSVRDVYSVMKGGVSLTICPLLSLGADQEAKFNLKALDATGPVVAIHLDEIRSLADQRLIVDKIMGLSTRTHMSVLLFSSPQAICNKKFLWQTLIDWLIVNQRMSMVCVDEMHLFVHFGMTFRDEFKELTPLLFKKLMTVGSTTTTQVPLLFMTATCTKRILSTIELMSGLLFDTQVNVFWPTPDAMAHRHVLLDVQYSISPLSVFKKKVEPRLKVSTKEKYIIYSNTRACIDRITPKLTDWIDAEGHKADVLKVVGTLMREQKFYHIKVFTRSNESNVDVLTTCREDARPFNPQILTATSGAANAGIDDPDVFGVCRMDFPPSLMDVHQWR
jgi:superfamily II DNA helicase RecQ